MTEIASPIGANVATTSTEPPHALGARASGVDGSEWVHVKASSAIARFDAVAFDEDFEAQPLTKALADDGWFVGAAQTAFAKSAYGWVCVKGAGGVKVNVKASCAADVALYTSSAAGRLDDAASGQTKIAGIVIVAAASSQAAARECLMTHPRSAGF